MRVVIALIVLNSLAAAFDVFDFVDPFIGTLNGGHVFPGATLPYGMAKAVADSKNPVDGQGGFASDDSLILGFSHMHDSGTGGVPSMGNFPIFPQTGCAGDLISNCFFTKDDRSTSRLNESVEAHPGYFALTLNTTIRAEMTVTSHTALYRFTFPSPSTNTTANQTLPHFPLILVELTDLQDSINNGYIEINNTTGRLSGNGTFMPSFGVGTYNLSFCIDFSGGEVRNTGLWYDIPILNQRSTSNPAPLPAGGWTQFYPPASNQLLVRVGLSFISISRACANAEREIPTFNFSSVLTSAQSSWRSKLSVILLDSTGISPSLQKLFWSGVYRSMISPQDYTGENPLWASAEPYFDSFYCIWDGFRSTFPLLTILDPGGVARMVRGLIDVYRFEGYLPDCRMSLCKGFTQGGSNADVVLADAYLKNITEGVNWTTAYEAVLKNAEVQPLDWTTQGRGGLASWKSLGYIPINDYDPFGGALRTRSISRTVEYAYNDFCLSLLSPFSPTPSTTHSLYHSRSTNWQNLFLPTQTSPTLPSTSPSNSNFTGFLQPRFANGTFAFQDPVYCSPVLGFEDCGLDAGGGEMYEGSVFLYTFYAPHQMSTLITLLGGPERFVERLTYLHTSGLLYVGNEQAFLTVYQFHYAGRPGLSSYFSRFYIPSSFNASVGGLPGNDDSGAMGAFSVLAMMGLWPVAGQDVYLITPPFFKEVRVRNGNTGKVATVRCTGFEGNIYIQSAKLDGVVWERNWLQHSFWLEGGLLELVLGREESAWGTREEDLPPSY
ncbi:glycoside hydrolase family 92 protein [Hyaloscypha variabilis]